MNIQLHHINYFYGSHQVLHNISLACPYGKTTVILGPSGAGKSSLLKIFNLLEKPTEGSLSLANIHCDFSQPIDAPTVKKIREKVGMVFQNYNLWPHLTVMENLIIAPCKVLGTNKKQATEMANNLLVRLQLTKFGDKYPLYLSGGQQQRVAIARALMMKPQVLLFDEPTAALDPGITSQLVQIIDELSMGNITQIVVTHEVKFAKKIADCIVYLENGYIIEQGDASRLTQPHTLQLKNYLSH